MMNSLLQYDLILILSISTQNYLNPNNNGGNSQMEKEVINTPYSLDPYDEGQMMINQ